MHRTIVIGAGFGGLTAALTLAGAGQPVLVLESAPYPGGKARRVPSAAGPIDAGPTVLTQKWVFDAAFSDAGLCLDEFVTVRQEPLLARHFWSDGSVLDLWNDLERSAEAVRNWGGKSAEAEFRAVDREARQLWNAFERPVIRSPRPRFGAVALAACASPMLLPALRQTLAGRLSRLKERRLAQLFGRYATYVGGIPQDSPALLSLVWRAEAAGVWRVDGGIHALALGLADAIRALGGEVRCGCHVTRIDTVGGLSAHLAGGEPMAAREIVFAGDPAALRDGLVGPALTDAVGERAVTPRSLSARVWTFAATPSRHDLAHHNVFFGDDPEREFGPIAAGTVPDDPTLYICAQDRRSGTAAMGLERFEIIENAPAWDGNQQEDPACHTRLTNALARFGLSFSPTPDLQAMTGPRDFARLFPGSRGSLYGLSPHGLTAAMRRPTARTGVPGLYLAGGGCHPGAGVPMAALSGRHAAAAIMQDRASTSRFRPTATPGGMSTASRKTGGARSASSPS